MVKKVVLLSSLFVQTLKPWKLKYWDKAKMVTGRCKNEKCCYICSMKQTGFLVKYENIWLCLYMLRTRSKFFFLFQVIKLMMKNNQMFHIFENENNKSLLVPWEKHSKLFDQPLKLGYFWQNISIFQVSKQDILNCSLTCRAMYLSSEYRLRTSN